MAKAACRFTNWRSQRFLSFTFPWHLVSWFTMPLSYHLRPSLGIFLCHIKFGLLFLKYLTLNLWSNGMSFILQITAKKRLLNTVNKTKCQAAQAKVQFLLSLQSNTNAYTTRTWHYSEITLIYLLYWWQLGNCTGKYFEPILSCGDNPRPFTSSSAFDCLLVNTYLFLQCKCTHPLCVQLSSLQNEPYPTNCDTV